MALPYATENQLKDVKRELEKKINAGGGASGEIPTKLSQLTNDTGFITTAALTDYALKSELPDVSDFVKESELPDFSTYALKTEIPEVDGFATKEEVTEAVKDTVKYQSFQNPNDPAPRKTIQLANHDTLSGIGTNGQGYNIAMVSKWDKVDLGAAGLSINLNGKDARPTYNDDKELALKEDIPDIDMDEFEKEFKVWENRYFELLDELNENDNTLAENKKSKNKEKNKDKDIPKYTLKIRNTINYKEAIKSILTYVFDKKDSLITQIDSLIYDSPRVVVNKKFIDDIIDNITKGTLNNSKILMSMLIKLNSTIKRLPDNSILFARSKTRATHLKNAEVVFNPSSLNTSILELQLGNHKNNYRILYCAVNSTIILLTFRRKSSKKTEEKDIRDAETRCYENIILISNK